MKFNFDKIYERDMDFLILEEFVSCPDFAEMFLKQADICDATVLESHHSLVDIQHGESDIEIKISSGSQIFTVMIEDKIDAKAMPEQCARYHARGKKKVDSGETDKYLVYIVAPQDYLDSNPEAQNYPYHVSYESIKQYFDSKKSIRADYKGQIIQKALDTKKAGYVPIEHVAITEFWQKYYAFKKKYYPELMLSEITGPRGENAVWPWFNTEDKRIKIGHKSFQGYVDLTLPNMGECVSDVREFLTPLLDYDMKVVKTSKSASVRINTPFIDFRLPFENYDVEMHHALNTVERLSRLAGKIDYDGLKEFVVQKAK